MNERTRLTEIRDKYDWGVNPAPLLERLDAALLDAFRLGARQGVTRIVGEDAARYLDLDSVHPAPADRRKGPAERRVMRGCNCHRGSANGLTRDRTRVCGDGERTGPRDRRGVRSRVEERTVNNGHAYKPPVGFCAVEGCGVAAFLHDPPPPWRAAHVAPPGWESPEGTFWILRKVGQ